MTVRIDAMGPEELAARIREPWRTPEGAVLRALVPPTLELLTRGESVSPEEIAAAAGLPAAAARAALDQFGGVDWDEQGRVVGLGLTLRPTPHRFGVAGRTLFAWCALDTLIFPVVLGRPASIESPCRGTGEAVRVVVTPRGVEAVEPASAVVSVVAPQDLASLRRVLCANAHFFRSAEAASGWLERHPEATIRPVEEVFRLGRVIAEGVFGVARPAGAERGPTGRGNER